MTDGSTLPALSKKPTANLPASPTPWDYGEEVREHAFVCWIEADGNCERALVRLVELFSDLDPTRPMPSVQSIRGWSRRYSWPARMVAAVADEYPHITARQLARLVIQADRAQDVIGRILADGPMREGDAIRAKVAGDVLTFRGLGTAGNKGGQPVIARQRPADDIPSDESPAETMLRLLHAAR